MLQNKKDSALLLLNKAYEMAVHENNKILQARFLVDYAHFFFVQAKYNKAKEYLDRAAPLLKETDNYETHNGFLMGKANFFNISGKKDSAIIYYRKAENYNILKERAYRNWAVYASMSELYNQLDRHEEAEEVFNKAYALTIKKEGKPDHGYVLALMLNYYLSRNDTEKLPELIAEYDELKEERRRKKFVDPIHNLIHNLLDSRLENSTSFMLDMKKESLQDGDLNRAIIANSYLIKHHNRKKEFDKALEYAVEGEALAQKTGVLQNMYETKKMKYDVLLKKGDNTEAAKEATLLLDLKDSLVAQQGREKVLELEAKYETEQKQKEIELLTIRQRFSDKELALLSSDKKMAQVLLQQEIMKRDALARENILMDSVVKSEQAFSQSVSKETEKQAALNAALDRENNLKASQLAKEKRTKWILVAGAGLLLLSGISILALYQKQKKKNDIIQKQATDLEVLMKEIHHRVKNNLQVVSSLLDLQSHSISDAQAHEAVKEGKNRVQSMALIHQNLYSEGNIKGIRLKEYVSNLLQTLCDSYNITNDKVKINANIDDLNLDVDTMIPLGLVLNELVSNSFKYAFKEKQNGELNIMLKEQADQLHLMVSDNGRGFPAGLDLKTGKSFGMKMIRAFAQKLKAKLDIYNNNGAVVEMYIKKFKTA